MVAPEVDDERDHRHEAAEADARGVELDVQPSAPDEEEEPGDPGAGEGVEERVSPPRSGERHIPLQPVGAGHPLEALDDMRHQAERFGRPAIEEQRPDPDLGPRLPGIAVVETSQLLLTEIADPTGADPGGLADNEPRSHQGHRQRPRPVALLRHPLPPGHGDRLGPPFVDRRGPLTTENRVGPHHQFVTRRGNQRRIPARLARHPGDGADARGVEAGEIGRQDEALLRLPSGAIDPQADEVPPGADRFLDPRPGAGDEVGRDHTREHDLNPPPSPLEGWIGDEGRFAQAEAPGGLGGRPRQASRHAQFAGPPPRQRQGHRAELLLVENRRPLAEAGYLGGGHDLVAVIGRHAHDARLRIEKGLGERRRRGLPPGGDLGIDRTHGVVDERFVDVRRAEGGVGGEHDFLAGQRHEDGMPAGPRREPGHRLHAGESWVGEEAGQRQRTGEVARPRASLVGPVEAEHENAALAGAGEEPIEIAEHRPFDLRVAVARDR